LAFGLLRGPGVKRRGRLFGPNGVKDTVEHGGGQPGREESSCTNRGA
jgi:hypothetical protein